MIYSDIIDDIYRCLKMIYKNINHDVYMIQDDLNKIWMMKRTWYSWYTQIWMMFYRCYKVISKIWMMKRTWYRWYTQISMVIYRCYKMIYKINDDTYIDDKRWYKKYKWWYISIWYKMIYKINDDRWYKMIWLSPWNGI